MNNHQPVGTGLSDENGIRPLSKPKPAQISRWMIFHRSGEMSHQLVEVRDMMESINEPGDSGWVDSVDEKVWLGPLGCLVDFEQLFATPKAAIDNRISQLEKQIAMCTDELAQWRSCNT